MSTTKNPTQFALLSRLLHWLMAALIITMLFIGVSMVSSLGDYHRLVSIHRPLGILILILAAIRLVTRLLTKAPELPASISQPERLGTRRSKHCDEGSPLSGPRCAGESRRGSSVSDCLELRFA